MTALNLAKNIERKSFGNRLWQFIARRKTLFLGILFVSVISLTAIFAEQLAPYDPVQTDYQAVLKPPGTPGHLLGTDKFGRDIFSRIIIASRIDLSIGIICVLFPFVFGCVIGAISGYYGGAIDALLMRFVDISVAFPFYVLVITILAVLGPGLLNMYIALMLVGWIAYAKIIRGEVLVAKNQEYVLAARALGYSNWRILIQHLLPNTISPTVVFAMSDIVMVIMAGASLGFLGLGVQPPRPEWGVEIANGREFITIAPWLAIFPGLALALVGIAFSLLGDGLSGLLRPKD
jgi:peptide/nickel transport system permease protein